MPSSKRSYRLDGDADFLYEEGYLEIPEKPGLGIEIDEEFVKEKAKEGHSWINLVLRHEDGSIAEW
ncbi:hypothetical protein SPD48_12835 [Pseudogracilibacillus sp. SE30717A]|uniref:hypothetical protein n=1 Tax=Pseudogracilibacillus sp. SE30717A TaxID=3098293 RepID=UPI00300DE161